MICDKVSYNTQGEAKTAIIGKAHNRKKPMRIYRCTECGKFHVTTIIQNRGGMNPHKEKYKQDYTHVKPSKPVKDNTPPRKFIQVQEVFHTTYKPFAHLKIK